VSTPTFTESQFWVVKTPTGYFQEYLEEDGLTHCYRVASPLAEASRYDRHVAENVACGKMYGNSKDWVAMPASLRIEVHPPAGPGELSIYTLASWHGEFMLSSRAPLAWPGVALDALRRYKLDSPGSESSDPDQLLGVIELLLKIPGVELLHGSRYYHLGHHSEEIKPFRS
jgi:hypothetical protein